MAIDPKDLPVHKQCFPYEMQLEAGKIYSWCTCGLSEKDPLCDSAHKLVEGVPMRSHKFEVAEVGTYWLCGCKHTKTPPFCDGTHHELAKAEKA